jgi:heptose-I-phosphate ethanolaminephosphotransferase
MILLSFIFLMTLPFLLEFAKVGEIRESDFYARFLWSLVILGLAGFTNSLVILNCGFSFFWLFALFDVGYAWTFRNQFSVASVEAVFLTTRREANEFLQDYIKVELLILLLGLFVGWLVFVIYLSQYVLSDINDKNWLIAGALFSVLLIAFRLLKKRRFIAVLPGLIGVAADFFVRRTQSQMLLKNRRERFNSFSINRSEENDGCGTILFVIGESSSRWHYQLYGYPRETNPQLSQLDDLICVNHLCSSFAQTIPALSSMLTLMQTDGLASELSPSIIDFAHAAGYHTVWISNQELGQSVPLTIARSAGEYIFASGVAGETPDEQVLPYIEQALSRRDSKKLIIVHLMGSHIKYQLRYPKSFSYFDSDVGIKAWKSDLSDRHKQLINEYDNSIRYTDFVLARMIELLKSLSNQSNSAFIYVSDHGEEVFDTKDFMGHEPDNPTDPMLSVPCLLWLSNKEQFKLKARENLSSDRVDWIMIHSLMRFMSINDKDYYNYGLDLCE